jgi:RHS repeat-associated protein
MRDHLASVTWTGGDGVWQDMRFDPYGGRIATAPPPTLVSDDPSSRVRLGFTGQEEDDDLGLVNMNGRIYDPAIARFLTPDPLVSMHSPSQSWNRYSYAENSPLRFVDPSGFDPQDGSGGNGPPPGVHMECTSAFNCGYMTSSGVYLTQDNWNYWSGNYATSPVGPNVGSFDETGAGASAGITAGMVVASKDGQSQGGGGSGAGGGQDLVTTKAMMQGAPMGGEGTGLSADPATLASYVKGTNLEGRTIIDPTLAGTEVLGVTDGLGGQVKISPDAFASDALLTNVVRHEGVHVEQVAAGNWADQWQPRAHDVNEIEALRRSAAAVHNFDDPALTQSWGVQIDKLAESVVGLEGTTYFQQVTTWPYNYQLQGDDLCRACYLK